MTQTITIQDRNGMRTLLGRLRALLDELGKADDPTPFTEALAAAASGRSTGVLGGLSGKLEPTADGGCAPVYVDVVAAASLMTDACTEHIAVARASVLTMISDLTALLTNIDGADTAGVSGIRAAS